jgi:hypothetical protein
MELFLPPIPKDAQDAVRAFHNLCLESFAMDRSPMATAVILGPLAQRWPVLRDEVYELKAMGDAWRNARGHSLGDSVFRPPPADPPETLPEQTSWEF